MAVYGMAAIRSLVAIGLTIVAATLIMAPSPISELDPWRILVVFSLFLGGVVWLGRLSERRIHRRTAAVQERTWRELVEAKDQFIGNISHGLKTPLTGIVGFAHLLRESLDDGEERESVAMILEGSAELSRTLDNLMVAAQIDAGMVRTQLSGVWVGDVLAESMVPLGMQGAAVQAGCEDALLMVDTELFKHVLRNLLANAHQHGRPPIIVKGYHKSGRYFIEIGDSGPGIPRRFEDRIFDRFTDRSGTGIRGEVGLGLWIANQLSEKMGCAVSYRRMQGKSYFIVSVPLADE